MNIETMTTDEAIAAGFIAEFTVNGIDFYRYFTIPPLTLPCVLVQTIVTILQRSMPFEVEDILRLQRLDTKCRRDYCYGIAGDIASKYIAISGACEAK